MNKFLAIIILYWLLPALGVAQDSKTEMADTTDHLQEVVVTATRKSTNVLSVPYSISSVSKKEMEMYQYRTTPEALTGTPGIFVQKTNHGGGSPFVRGLTGNQTLLMIDGIRFNNATFRFGPNQYFNTIDAFTVSKIEVARGTGSVQYGSDALGGVIQVFTKDPAFAEKKEFHASAMGRVATNDMEYTGRGQVEYGSKKVAISTGYTKRSFGAIVGGDTTGKQVPSGYKEQAFDVKLKWKMADHVMLTVAHQYLQQKNVPLYHRVTLENFAWYSFAPQQREMSYVKLEIKGKNKWLDKLILITSLQKTLEKRTYQKNGVINKFLEEDKVRTLGFTTDVLSTISKGWTANSGIEFYHDKVNSYKQQINTANNTVINQRGLYPDNATNGNFSLYSLHHIRLKKFEIEAGLRYNSFAVTIPDTVTSVLKLGDITVKPSSLVSNIALLYPISRQQTVYSSFSTGFRAPNIDDMGTLGLVDFRYEIPAYDLQPEKTYNTEIGYRFSNKKLNASVAFFYMHLSNLITRIPVAGQQVGGYNVYTKENSQKSYLRGAETAVSYQLSNSLVVKANASYAYGQNLSRNEPMRRIPPFNGSILLNYQKHKWNAALENLLAGKQARLAQGDKDDNRIPAGGTPGWNITNVYGGYAGNHYSIRMALQNIFNKDYRTHGSGINGVGRSGWLSLAINF